MTPHSNRYSRMSSAIRGSYSISMRNPASRSGLRLLQLRDGSTLVVDEFSAQLADQRAISYRIELGPSATSESEESMPDTVRTSALDALIDPGAELRLLGEGNE